MEEKRVLQRRKAKPKTKRVLQRKTRRDWEVEIRTCLTCPGNSWEWGCLNKAGELFKILTLSSSFVPQDVLHGMIENGRLELQTDGAFYQYITK